MRRTVLIVEDEPDLVEVVRYNLEREGMSVVWAATGEDGLCKANSLRPDMILLDIMLPGRDGLDICRRLKSSGETAAIPIVIISARGDEADIVVGLELGADDYVIKPFSPAVLVARLRAVLRRIEAAAADGSGGIPDEVVTVGGLTINRSRYAAYAGERSLDLTKTEFEMLDFLARHRGRVFSRDQLLDMVQGKEVVVTDRTIDVHIAALRKKLGERADCIETVRGIGYRFTDDA